MLINIRSHWFNRIFKAKFRSNFIRCSYLVSLLISSSSDEMFFPMKCYRTSSVEVSPPGIQDTLRGRRCSIHSCDSYTLQWRFSEAYKFKNKKAKGLKFSHNINSHKNCWLLKFQINTPKIFVDIDIQKINFLTIFWLWIIRINDTV